MFVDEINIAFPILLVNRESDIFIEIPIFCVLIDKRKPITGMGCLEFVMIARNKRNSCCARLDIWDESPIILEGELKLIVL
ncbi:TPA: hypothetical protein ACJX6A_001023, partial [Acinetobacter baumannii]